MSLPSNPGNCVFQSCLVFAETTRARRRIKTRSKLALSYWFGCFPIDLATSVGKGKVRSQQLRNRLTTYLTSTCLKICSERENSMMRRWDSQPFRSRANSLPRANRPIEPWPILSLELSLPGPLAPWNLRSRALSLPGLLVTRLIE